MCAKNVCQCPKPPGGVAVCDGDQVAICKIVDGTAHTICLSPPNEILKRIHLRGIKSLIVKLWLRRQIEKALQSKKEIIGSSAEIDFENMAASDSMSGI